MGNIIKIDTGVKRYQLNEDVTVMFNPTDINFARSVFDLFDSLDEMHTSYGKKLEELQNEDDGVQVFEIADEMERVFREKLDGLFGEEICKPLLGTMSVYSLSEGLPFWANLLLAIIDELDTAFTEEKKKTNPRIQKYTEKYSRKK